jgi:hypothetical protein
MSNNNVVSVSNELINSHTTAALNVNGKFVITDIGPVWGKKNGHTIPTLKVKVISGTDNNTGKELKKGKFYAVGCSNLIQACNEVSLKCLFTDKDGETQFNKETEFRLSVDKEFRTTVEMVASDDKPTKKTRKKKAI